MIEVSESAQERIKKYVEENSDGLAIRVFLSQGG